MKIAKRIFFGIMFVPAFAVTLLLVSPVNWVLTGEFDSPILKLGDFYGRI